MSATRDTANDVLRRRPQQGLRMTVVALGCFAFAAASAIAMQVFDARMQRYRSPVAPASAFRWVPMRWWDPDLYVGDGQKYRRAAIRSWWLTVAFFVAGAIAVAMAS